jgi:branched-chain amino acid transport system permease protein
VFWQQLVNGLMLGITYALIALAFNLVVGALDKLNFALGETSMVAAMVAVVLLEAHHLSFGVGLAVAMVVGAAVATASYFLCFYLVDDRYFTAPILSSLGLGLVLSSAVTRKWGSDHRRVPTVAKGVRIDLGPVTITGSQLVIIAIAAVLAVAMYVFLEHTIWGTAIRGVSDDPSTAALLGVPVQRIIVLTFALSGVLAGSAGLLSGLSFHTVSPFDGFNTTLVALMIIVVGGLGSISGGVVAALLIGVTQILSAAYMSATQRDLIVYVLVAVVVLVRPQGLLGRDHGVLERV